MPYSVGAKGSYGCSGYPVLKDDDKQVMGCHDTAQEAAAQIAAIEANEGKTYQEKDTITSGGGVGIKNPQAWPGTEIKDPKLKKDLPDAYRPASSEGVPPGQNCANCIFYDTSKVMDGKAYCTKWDDYVLPNYYCKAWAPEEESLDKACWDGYAQRGMKPGQGGRMVPNCVPVSKVDDLFEDSDDVVYHDDFAKADDTYSPNDGMKSAARRALKWKEDGKATGAGTPVGWGRATDIVAGRSMSLSTVKRMFSFFSRHEQASKGGKDFNNTSNPSNGRIMWDAWGGDAGFTWSRAIVNRMKDKALFSDFGKDWTRSTGMTDLFKAKGVSVGDHVTFGVPKPPAGTMRAHGKVERVSRSGKVTLPGSNESAEATSENPVAVVRVWATKEDGMYQETDRRVVKPFSALTVSDAPLEKIIDEDFDKAASGKESRFRELVEEYNKGKEGSSRLTVGLLRRVYNRGIGAYRTNSSSVRPNVSSAEQWAMARVNAYMKGLRGRFPRSAFDLDLFPSGHPRHSKGEKK